MEIISSTDARNHLSVMLEKAQHAPVMIQKQGRDTAVLISSEEYARLSNAAALMFNAVANRIGAYAASKGMTEEKLEQLLADNSPPA